jgi:hypothetical protein
MSHKNLNPKLESEIITGLHFIRKSANSLMEDLRYLLNKIFNKFN